MYIYDLIIAKEKVSVEYGTEYKAFTVFNYYFQTHTLIKSTTCAIARPVIEYEGMTITMHEVAHSSTTAYPLAGADLP